MPEHLKFWSHVHEGPKDLNERLTAFVIPPGTNYQVKTGDRAESTHISNYCQDLLGII